MKTSLKEKSYNYIKEKIITCEYMPGHFLDEKELINEIGASRTPIREALNKLEQENLLQILPKKGVIVSDVSLQHIIDIHELRLIIEPVILEKFSHKIDKSKIQKFLEDSKNISSNSELNIYDYYLHDYFISLYENQYITSTFENMSSQQKRIRELTSSTTACFDQTMQEHENILQAILKDDWQQAKIFYEQHILNSKERTIASLLKNNL